MDKINKLRQYGKKTISKDGLERLFSEHRPEEMFTIVRELEMNGLLSPVKSSGINGNMQYPIYLKYKITLPQETFETELTEIAKLHPQLQRGGYLQQKPAEYRKYRSQLQELDRYLFRTQQDRTPISRKERSFEIFSEEKELDSNPFCALLEKLGLNHETLFFYDTPEYCFNDYIPQDNVKDYPLALFKIPLCLSITVSKHLHKKALLCSRALNCQFLALLFS